MISVPSSEVAPDLQPGYLGDITSGDVRIRGFLLLFMSFAAALGTSAIYPMQPAIADVADSLSTSITLVGVGLAFGPVGYLVGIVLLVPLVDRYSPNRVLAGQFFVLAISLAATAIMNGVVTLALAMAAVGICSAVGASLSSLTARLGSSRRSATSLGIVTAGISAGVLSGRILGGFLADEIGWRAMVLVFATACLIVAGCSLRILPGATGTNKRDYFSTLRLLPSLVVQNSTLRAAAIRGALWFFAFSAVWAGLAVALSEAPYSYSSERIGLCAVAGLSGILVTPIAGLLTDRIGAHHVIVVSLVLAGIAAVVAGLNLVNTPLTLLCLAVFDAGLFAAQVANQNTVLAIDRSSPARFNSAYMVIYFIGGGAGTAFGAAAVDWMRWPTTAMMTAIAIGAALVLTLLNNRPVAPVVGTN